MASDVLQAVSRTSGAFLPPQADRIPIREILPAQALTVTTAESARSARDKAGQFQVDKERSVSQEKRSEATFSDGETEDQQKNSQTNSKSQTRSGLSRVA